MVKHAKRNVAVPPSVLDEESISGKMALFEQGVDFSITINPDDSSQHFTDPVITRISLVRAEVITELTHHSVHEYINNISLYLDLSTPSQMDRHTVPRYHYHGTIQFRDAPRFWAVFRPRSSVVEIDTISDPKGWMRYCTKFEDYGDPKYSLYRINLKNLQDSVAITGTKVPLPQLTKEWQNYEKIMKVIDKEKKRLQEDDSS